MPTLVVLFFLQILTNLDPKLQWTTPQTHDFGNVLRGQVVTYFFEYKNISNEPLVLDNVRTDCGCTASDWEETPTETGKIGKISITFESSKIGYFRKKITVWIRGQRTPEKLSIEGEVVE